MKYLYTLLGCGLLFAPIAAAQNHRMPHRVSTELERPVVLPATNITNNAFTAHWQPVEEAEAYCVFVYTKDVVTADGEYTIVDEDFNGIDFGSLIEPAGGDEYGVNLSEYGYANTYGWEAYAYPTFAPGMVAGSLYSPYLYLVNDEGRYQVHITTYASRDDQIRVESHGEGEPQLVIYQVELSPSQSTGVTTKTLDFDNGSRDLFFSAINITAQVGVADYIDRIKVTQQLCAGDEVYTNIASDEAVMAEDDYGYEVTTKRFTLPARYLNGKTVVYYDIYAAMHDFTTPNGSVPYTLVTSPYSNRVLVDLANRTSEVLDDDHSGIAALAPEASCSDDECYDLMGRKIAQPSAPGIYIKGGKKIIVR